MNFIRKTKDLCSLYNIKPAHSCGQNFLIKKDIYNKIIASGDLTSADTILEVGSGFGFLTFELAKKVNKVVAVELDEKLAVVLEDRIKKSGYNNIELINKDILSLKPEEDILDGDNKTYKILANLPYNITSIFLRKFLSETRKPESMVLMIQKEVAERILSKPPASVLSVMVNFYSNPCIISFVSQDCFWPQPQVDSAIIKLIVKKETPNIKEDYFFQLVKAGYHCRRKMLKNNLSSVFNISCQDVLKKLNSAHISPNVRAQELSVKDWINFFEVFRENMIQ